MRKYSVVICGGGSTYTPDMLELLCIIRKSFPLRKVVLYDCVEERQRIVGEFGKVLFSEYYEDVEFGYTTSKEEAFRDIDFAFVQIRAGGMELPFFHPGFGGLAGEGEPYHYRHRDAQDGWASSDQTGKR